jgi:hypothetical protein
VSCRVSATPLSETSAETIIDSPHSVGYREYTAISDASSNNSEAWTDYAAGSDWIERFLPTPAEKEQTQSQSDKDQILPELNFESGLAEQQENFLDTFVEVGTTRRALDSSVPIILGRKGVGKTAIFRRLLEKKDIHSVPITAPGPLSKGEPWLFSSEGFAAAEVILQSLNAEWRSFWKLLIILACNYSAESLPRTAEIGHVLLPQTLTNNSAVIDLMVQIFSLPRAGLVIDEALEKLELNSQSQFLLLFDGLDTGFGSAIKDRARRQNALQGLFELVLNRISDQKMRFKIVLREDIWRVLKFENKSHFYGHSVLLEWKDQSSYYKVVLKQAIRSNGFKSLIGKVLPKLDLATLNDWTEREVTAVWNVLVGERMKGGNTAKTANWVWNRLADANDDHSPRYLLQLFRVVLAFERGEQKRSNFERSILRPRGLSVSLPTVSVQALDSLANEEFPELTSLLAKLQDIGRTPFNVEDVEDLPEQLALAREVGLVGVYEGTEEKVERYRIPEIYRYALKMTRRGQA